ncbi:MAG: glutamate--tRNA ligase [Oscillospiraceae bacterium]|nr:glutamate--tRNA ligase [Oscillospiraceae bacterium]
MEASIPRGGVRTRFAPSPTGYMHVGGLRTALYAYLIAKKAGGAFILRIEDTDASRFVEGAVAGIYSALRGAGLEWDEGPQTGGPCAPYAQSKRRALYRPYADLLCERGYAYYCFCGHISRDERRDAQRPEQPSETRDPCRDTPREEAARRVSGGESHVIRMKAPREGTTSFRDEIFGDITVENTSLDDMVLIKSDGMPTYNFANVVDDHLMGVTHVVRGSEYLSSAPKYNLLYGALGWDAPVYMTVSPIMRDKRNKFSKRHGDATYDDLLAQGYMPAAIVNYIALLGWSPGGEREIFTLSELIKAFDVKGISKSPAIFDPEKLAYFNGSHIRSMTPDEFAAAAEPYIRRAVTSPDISVPEIAEILQPRCERLTEISEKIDFIERLPDYSLELFEHKKSKCDAAVALDMLLSALVVFQTAPDWARDTIRSELTALADSLGVKSSTLMWPVRIAVSGRAATPGGAVEICRILGRSETLRRVGAAIERLSSEVSI